jgi:hypothetical protein
MLSTLLFCGFIRRTGWPSEPRTRLRLLPYIEGNDTAHPAVPSRTLMRTKAELRALERTTLTATQRLTSDPALQYSVPCQEMKNSVYNK